MVVKGQLWQGPLPHPEALIRYNDAQPGAADRIIKMAEKEQRHRHFVEKLIGIANVLAEYFGLALAAALFGGIAWGGFQLIQHGYQATGISTIISAILGPLVTFLLERRKH